MGTWELQPLLSGRSHLLAVPARVLPLLSPLLSSCLALDTLSLAVFQEYNDERKLIQSELEGDDQYYCMCGPIMLLLLRVCFEKKEMFLLKIMFMLS